MINKNIVLILIFVLSINFISSSLGYDNPNLPKLESTTSTTTSQNITNNYYNSTFTNGTTYTFNDTQFSTTNNYVSILESWLTTFGNNMWCSLSGCSMTGNLETTGNVTADYFIGDGSLLTGISAEETDFETYINGSAYNNIHYNLTAGDVDDIKRTIEPGKQFIFGDSFT